MLLPLTKTSSDVAFDQRGKRPSPPLRRASEVEIFHCPGPRKERTKIPVSPRYASHRPSGESAGALLAKRYHFSPPGGSTVAKSVGAGGFAFGSSGVFRIITRLPPFASSSSKTSVLPDGSQEPGR